METTHNCCCECKQLLSARQTPDVDWDSLLAKNPEGIEDIWFNEGVNYVRAYLTQHGAAR